MSRQSKSGTVKAKRGPGVPRPSGGNAGAKARNLTAPGDALLRSRYQHLTRKHLRSVFKKVITEFTGLNFHIAWAPAASDDWERVRLPSASSACCRLARAYPGAREKCRRCGTRQLARSLNTPRAGRFSECPLGVLGFWLPIRIRDITVGIACLQALDAKTHEAISQRCRRTAIPVLSRAEFRRGTRLLHLVVDYLQTLDLAELRKNELTNAGHAVLALEREQAWLHQALKRHLPTTPLVSRHDGTATHGDGAVHQLLEWIAGNFAEPITLKACAAKLGMNAAYLSDLFSHAVGVSFKTYLTELRLLKAKELLGDSNQTVTAVAFAVGYANENRFRAIFKKATGLAPGIWRETLRARP